MKFKGQALVSFFQLASAVTAHFRGRLFEDFFLEDWASIGPELAAKEAELLQKEASLKELWCYIGEEMVDRQKFNG